MKPTNPTVENVPTAIERRRASDRKRYGKPARRKACLERGRRWHEENPERVHARSLRRTHGIAYEAYEQLVRVQNGCCAICQYPPTGKSRRTQLLHVDHDHASNLIRALLCTRCNMAIGLLRDDPDICVAAADYLKKWAKAVQKTLAK